MDLFDIVISGKIRKEGGGGDVEVDALSVTENGTYSASSGHAYSPVTVSVPTGIIPSGTISITSNGVFDVGSFASADVNVSGGGGDHEIEDWLVSRQVSSVYTNSRVTIIGDGAFAYCSKLTEASFPNAENIGSYAFNSCSALSAINAPKVTLVGAYAFSYNTMLQSVNLPQLSSLGMLAFYNCRGLETLSMPSLQSAGQSAFNGCSSLKELYAPNLSRVGYGAFAGCHALSIANFPNLSSLGGSQTFSGCSALTQVSIPLVGRLDSSTFQSCIALSTISLMVSRIESAAFKGCTSLMSVYMLSNSAAYGVVTMFSNTPMSNSTYTGAFGSIYVPASLVNEYKSKNGWSAYSDRITSIPEE